MTSNLTSAETVDAKRAFERFAAEHGVRVQHYHCDNGQFADSMFCEACMSELSPKGTYVMYPYPESLEDRVPSHAHRYTQYLITAKHHM
jgi:hypothetical protein